VPSATITESMPRDSATVFALLHDYSRRLEWDTLLREARLTRGHTVSAVGATALCVGKPLFGLIGVETRYVTFTPGVVAAVRMINAAPFFETFSASIRHQDARQGSTLTYKLSFTARPQLLRWVLEPIMLACLRYETKRRLQALSLFLCRSERTAL